MTLSCAEYLLLAISIGTLCGLSIGAGLAWTFLRFRWREGIRMQADFERGLYERR